MDVITGLGQLAAGDKEQNFKIFLRYKNNKVTAIIEKDGISPSYTVSGSIPAISEQWFERFKKHLNIIEGDDTATDEIVDNLEETEAEVKEEKTVETKSVGGGNKRKAADKKPAGKKPEIKNEEVTDPEPEPESEPQPVQKSALEQILEKADKAQKTLIDKMIIRVKKGINDPDMMTFLKASIENSLKNFEDQALVKQLLSDLDTMKEEPAAPPAAEKTGMFAGIETAPPPVQQPTPPPPPVAPRPAQVAIVTQPPAPAPIPQPVSAPVITSFALDEEELF